MFFKKKKKLIRADLPEVDVAVDVKISKSESHADPTCLALFGEGGWGGWRVVVWSWAGSGGEGERGAAGVDHAHNRLFIVRASR